MSCSSPRTCTAAGYYRRGAGNFVSLAERWNGKKWTLERTPNPTGATDSELQSVSCTSARACTAVGYDRNSAGRKSTLAERRNDKKWTLEPTLNPTEATYSELESVSCTGARACLAVGSYENTIGQYVTLAERWNGKKWMIEPTPNPAKAVSFLYGVSCTSAKACTAVGYYRRGAVKIVTFAERWNGKKWTIESMPTPAGAVGSFLYGVSCTAADACTAVGDYQNGAGQKSTLAERWNGKMWAIEPTPTPAAAAWSYFYGVSCTAADACTAVGPYRHSAGKQLTLAEYWNGKRWTIEPTPNPASATSSCLYGASCTAGGACTAVGHSQRRAGRKLTLAERHL